MTILKRSVRTDRGSWPRATRISAAASTNDVGPQMKTAGLSAAGSGHRSGGRSLGLLL